MQTVKFSLVYMIVLFWMTCYHRTDDCYVHIRHLQIQLILYFFHIAPANNCNQHQKIENSVSVRFTQKKYCRFDDDVLCLTGILGVNMTSIRYASFIYSDIWIHINVFLVAGGYT